MNLNSLLRRFSIRLRMMGAIAIVLTLLVLVGSVGLHGMREVSDQARTLAKESLASAHTTSGLNRAMGDMRRAEKDMLIKYRELPAVREEHSDWKAHSQTAQGLTKALSESATPSVQDFGKRIAPLLQNYNQLAEPVLAQLLAGKVEDPALSNEALRPAKDSFKAAEKLLVDLQKQLDHEADLALDKANDTQRAVLTVFVAVLVISALVVIPLTLMNMYSICTPLAQAEQLASDIAQGNLLRTKQDVEGADEAAKLLRALIHMQENLRGMVQQLHEAAGSIRTASVEIANGNQDLSGRTEQTASNLQNTASSMVQLTGTVKQTADAARTANQLATSASSAAARGGDVVGQVVSTMDEINTSSKRIGDIIGVIDGIAFQTNILALNAAVEAARAGEQGRGFAVVAGEVRSLAQRSAEAAREIKTLIGASVDRVETGARLVQDAGTSMADIVSSVQRVSDIIGEITAAASEQSDGISQVNQSVAQLDQMTQQNAALVEESAAAAESLKEQAERLSGVVNRFRTDSASPAAAASSGHAQHSRAASHAAAAHSTHTARPAGASKTASPAHTARAVAPATARTPAPVSVNKVPAPKPVRPEPSKPQPQAAPAMAEGDWETF
ncbi:methyl-accepting chemotaxis protein [Roseateles sp. BYS180W]|uniref:Methyl-accepting chemotaxis protein n=1 Tax=Roseateles rivi TaxID=3299028 RepID=A0ABW7FV45_9BURK